MAHPEQTALRPCSPPLFAKRGVGKEFLRPEKDRALHHFRLARRSIQPIRSGTDARGRRSCCMSPMNDKGLGKRARRQVSERLRAYHDAVIRMVEPDTEAFFDRVMQRARSEHLAAVSTEA